MTAGGRTRPVADAPKFVSGSVLRHILEMTGTGALGLMAIFIGDLANIYFLSLSGEQSTVAAVGYASSILYFVTSIGIGLSIASRQWWRPPSARDGAPSPAGCPHMRIC